MIFPHYFSITQGVYFNMDNFSIVLNETPVKSCCWFVCYSFCDTLMQDRLEQHNQPLIGLLMVLPWTDSQSHPNICCQFAYVQRELSGLVMLLFGLISFPKFTIPVQVQFISLPILISVSVCLQDYLMTHMYGNAARDDLWNKFSEVRS